MATDVQPGNLDFPEAIEYFRGKVNLPTEKWTDLMKGQHTRAFVVAGATKAELLSDIRAELDKALAQGTGLEEFREAFDEIVARHGWSYKGSRNWRTRVIFETNMRTAYQAGRFAQLKEAVALRPYWQYRHGDSLKPRPLHLKWDRLVLRHDDPWWETHYPPNGWGCKCTVLSLGEEDLADQGKKGPDRAPDDGVGPKPDPVTGEPVPAGIDPGWDYNVGESAWGRPTVRKTIADQARPTWKEVPGGKTAEDLGLPRLPADKPRTPVGPTAKTPEDLPDLFKEALGDAEVYLPDPRGEFVVADQVLADDVAGAIFKDHLEEYFPLVPEVVAEPAEVWATFAQDTATGRYSLRERHVKAFDLGKRRTVVLVAETVDGIWTKLVAGTVEDVEEFRYGYLAWAAGQEAVK